MSANAYTELVAAIRDGTYPASEELLADDINVTNIPSLQEEIAKIKEELSQDISKISGDQASDIDGWIEQAKKVQADIARCKQEAHLIVQEHERVEALRNARDDSKNKVRLLQDEIAFNEALEQQIQGIAEINQSLNQIDLSINEHRLLQSARALPGLTAATKEINASQPQALLQQSCDLLRDRLKQKLQDQLDQRIVVFTSTEATTIDIHSQPSDGLEHATSTDELLESLEALGLTSETVAHVLQKLDRCLLPPFYRRSKRKISAAKIQSHRLLFQNSSSLPTVEDIITTIQTIHQYLLTQLPQSLQKIVSSKIVEQLIPFLITEWLDHAVSSNIADLQRLDELQRHVEGLVQQFAGTEISSIETLELWIRQLPRTWLAKRRTTSLDAVRQAFRTAHGITKQVQRVETQTIKLEPEPEVAKPKPNDDWDAVWDAEEERALHTPSDSAHTPPPEDEEGDAWGFDDEDDHLKQDATERSQQAEAEDDDGAAWGWGDDDNAAPEAKSLHSSPHKQKAANEPNGNRAAEPAEHEITLTETYSISDIPESVLAVVKNDLQDAQALQMSPPPLSRSSSTATALQSAPTLILSLYRAIAPTVYTIPPLNLSSLHLYNDTLYLIDQLPHLTTSPYPSLPSDTTQLRSFAKQTYTSTLQTHHTLLTDLLDTAQSFTSCTRQPYAQACDTAIASVTAHLRSLHTEWGAILGKSHLQQALGSLLSSVLNKVVTDILDLEDISEAESKKLVTYLDQLSSLSDLFPASLSPKPDSDHHQPEPSGAEAEAEASTVHIFVTPWFRFQYLKEILDSNLMDIKYMWTEGGLREDFDKDEVVDLIRALFAESARRKEVISGIKYS